jgi:hypothetical protein
VAALADPGQLFTRSLPETGTVASSTTGYFIAESVGYSHIAVHISESRVFMGRGFHGSLPKRKKPRRGSNKSDSAARQLPFIETVRMVRYYQKIQKDMLLATNIS